MSFLIVTARRDDASTDLAKVHGLLTKPEQQRALMSVVGVRGEQELRKWFFHRDETSPNKHGWPRQHFWAQIARRTAYDPAKTTEHSATVVVSDPRLGPKLDGPTTIKATGAVSPITGKPVRNLALPLTGEVYGRWPRGNPVAGLFALKIEGKGLFLVAQEGGGLAFYYRLVPEVTVPRDPDALPRDNRIGAALGATARTWFQHFGAGGKN